MPIKVQVIIAGDEMTVDFSELAAAGARTDQRRRLRRGSPRRGSPSNASSRPHSGVTQGEFGPLKVILPPGTLLSATRPAPLGGWSLSLPTVIDTILLALAPALPDRIPAAHKGDMSGLRAVRPRPRNAIARSSA